MSGNLVAALGEYLLTQLKICFLDISTYVSFYFFFPFLGLWSGNFFLIVPFPDHCLLVPLYVLGGAHLYVCYGVTFQTLLNELHR